jgi:hypothetical protein
VIAHIYNFSFRRLISHASKSVIIRCEVEPGVKDYVMKKEIGLWIDHRKAVIVTIENDIEATMEIRSNVEKFVQISSGTQTKEPKQPKGSKVGDMRDRQIGNHLNSFYDGIISMINVAESIWVFGPGEAKDELEKRLKLAGLGEHIVGVETVKMMTDQQIAEKIRNHYMH